VWRTDRRTDRQTDVKPIAITCFSIADARKNWKFYREKQRVTKIVINDTKSCPFELESNPLKVSCHRINYRSKTIGDDCPTIVRLSSDVIVRWDYRHNSNNNNSSNTTKLPQFNIRSSNEADYKRTDTAYNVLFTFSAEKKIQVIASKR